MFASPFPVLSAFTVRTGFDLCLGELGLQAGSEILMSALTIKEMVNIARHHGLVPIPLDIESGTMAPEIAKIEAAITERTRAIVMAHLFGTRMPMGPVIELAKKKGILVIEDCAQAIGARGDSFSIGELSDAVCLSFIIQKNLGCFGDGGAVATNNADLAAAVRKLRNHGSLKRSHHSIGYNSRLDDLHAAVLRVKLKRVDEWTRLRQGLASEYDRLLADAPLTRPYTPPGYQHVYHLYVVECDDRDGLQEYLASRGITALTHYPIAIHQQEGFPWGREARVHALPFTEQSAARVLSLPMYPELTKQEVEYVADAIRAWVGQKAEVRSQEPGVRIHK